MIESTLGTTVRAIRPTLPLFPKPQYHTTHASLAQDAGPAVTITATPTVEQLQTWWDAMQRDDLSVAYNDEFPTSLTDFRLEVAQGTKLLLLALVDGQVAGALWLHDMVYRPDGTVSAGWVGGYTLPAYRGPLGSRGWLASKKHWEAQGIRHFFTAAHIANRRSQAFIARCMRFHRVDISQQFAFYNGELTDVVFYTANRHDAQLARQCAQARAQRQWYLVA